MVNKKNLLLFSLITISLVILDQLLKFLILKFQPSFNLNFLSIHLVKNTGAGFGLFQGYSLFLAILSLIVTVLIISYYPKIPQKKFPQIFVALFLGGVIGNLIDRLFRKFVIDFIDFSFWPAFNLADSAITISAIGLVIYFWKK